MHTNNDVLNAVQPLQVFVINLDRDRERLDRFTARMENLKVPFTRWRATLGDELDSAKFGVEPIEPGVYVTGFREWGLNEAACGVSHIKLLQHIVHKRIRWAAVLEDDGLLTQGIPLDIDKWELPEDAEIVMLNERAHLFETCYVGPRFSYGRLSGGAGTDGYLISLSGAQKLLKILYPLHVPIDFQMYAHCLSVQQMDQPPYYWKLPQNPMARNVLLQAYRIVPALVVHADGLSTIGNQRHPRARYYCNVLLGLYFEEDDTYNYLGAYNYVSTYNYYLGNLSEECPIVGAAVVQPTEWRAVDISLIDEAMKFSRSADEPHENVMCILRDHGVNAVRIIIWVDPASRLNLHRALRLAKSAYQEGLQVYLALHYSDTWTDPAHQTRPYSWSNLSIDKLCQVVYRYTRDVVEAMCAQGTPPAIVQTGNEVTNGMLWAKSSEYDEGREHLLYDQQWPAFARLMKQAIRGVREADGPPGHHPKVMLHIDKGHSPGIAAWWFDKARAYEIDFDIIGLSYYFLHHEEANLEGIVRLACLSASFPGKEIMLAETSYPYRPVPGMARFPSPNDPPFTREGQKEYLSRALDAMRHVPNGAGLCWWGAFFVNDAIEPCNDDFRAQALFDETGIPLLALSAFGE